MPLCQELHRLEVEKAEQLSDARFNYFKVYFLSTSFAFKLLIIIMVIILILIVVIVVVSGTLQIPIRFFV